MAASSGYLSCDGCGLPASPEHIAERVRRLELATRFRPIHIDVLFVAVAPPLDPNEDLYGPPRSNEFFAPFLDAMGIGLPPGQEGAHSEARGVDAARVAEFQRRGYYLAYVSECPLADSAEFAATISRLAPTLIRRIRFNYRPKHVAPLGAELAPLTAVLRAAGIESVPSVGQGAPLPVPRHSDSVSVQLYQSALASLGLGARGPGGYDRIHGTKTERSSKAGGGS